jgi:hypothetical protein
MPVKLSPEECVTLSTLKQKGQSNAQIARTLGVTEGTIRYRLRRDAAGTEDGRQNKPHRADPLARVIDHFVQDHHVRQGDGHTPCPINVRTLYEYLIADHHYQGSYRSVLRFVRAHYPAPKLRPFRRVETPPGAQAQVDWGEIAGSDWGAGPQTLYAFVMVLSHSRKEVLIWCQRTDQLAWHHAAALQGDSDKQLARWDQWRVCPATGRSVEASWQAELPLLRPLPLLPEVFDVALTRPVHKDCTVNFEGRTYSVPFRLCGLRVEVRGCASVVQIVHEGRVVAEHPRGTAERLLIDPSHYEGEGDGRVDPPVPLGQMGRRLQAIVLQPVEQRPLDLYAALAEVAR